MAIKFVMVATLAVIIFYGEKMNRKKKVEALKVYALRANTPESKNETVDVSKMELFEKSRNLDLVGGCYVGNTRLLTHPWRRIGVFASRSSDPAVDVLREQWAMKMGRTRQCIVGTFHSPAECEILYLVLKFGGFAVWFMGCSLPEKLPNFCKGAIRKGRLLMVSCFHREHHTYATARYCVHLTDMYSGRLAVWSMKTGGMIQPIYDRAIANGKMVEVF